MSQLNVIRGVQMTMSELPRIQSRCAIERYVRQQLCTVLLASASKKNLDTPGQNWRDCAMGAFLTDRRT